MPESLKGQDVNPFAQKAYRSWFWGGTFQALGQGLALAITLVLLAVTESPSLAGLALGLYSLLEIIASILGGYYADFTSRKKIIVYSSFGNVVINGFLSVVLFLWWNGVLDGSVVQWVIIPALLFSACAYGFSDPAFDGALKSLISAEQFPRAMGAAQVRSSAVSIIGNPLAGLLFAIAVVFPFVAKLLFEVIFLLFMGKIKEDFGPVAREKIAAREFPQKIIDNYVSALKFIRTEPVVARILVCAPLLNFLVFGTTAWTVLSLRQSGSPAWLIGCLTSGFAAGAIVGGLLTPWITDRFSAGPVALVGLGSMIFLYSLYFWSSSSPYLMLICAFFCMVPSPPLNAGLFAHVYTVTPLDMQGRVHALFTLVGGLGAVLGPVLAGATADLGNPLWFAAPVLGSALLGYLMLWLSPEVRRLS